MVERVLIALPSQLQLIDRLQHLIYLSSSLIFIAGRNGSGKTALMEQLSNQLPSNVQEAFINLNETVPDEQIRQQIITQLFEHPLFDANDTLFTTFVQLQEKFNVDIPQVIIIDNSDYLSNQLLSELAQLMTLKTQVSESEINVLLLGNDEIINKQLAYISDSMPKHDPNCTCLEFKIEPLNGEETSALLDHMFSQNGYQSEVQHQDALSQKLNGCAGNPKKIIVLAEEIIAGKLENTEVSKFRARLPAFLFMCLLLLIVIVIAIQLKDKFFEEPQSEQVTETLLVPQPFAIEEIAATNLVADSQISQGEPTFAGEALAGNWKDQHHDQIAENKLMVGISDDSVTRVVISEQEIANSIGGSELAIVELEMQVSPSETELKEQFESPSGALQTTPLAVLIEDEKIEVIEEPDASFDKVSDAEGLTQVEVLVKEVQESVRKNSADPIFTAREKLLAINPDHYTLQLLAMDSKDSLQRFIRVHNLPQKNVFVYQTKHNNKPRYMVIFGDYATRKLAQQGAKKLPGSLAKMDGWIKKYRLVHQDLQQNND